MAITPNESAVRLSAEAAKNFVDFYYSALNDAKPIASCYVNSSPTYRAAGHPPADICINGLVVATAEEWDKMLVTQRTVANPNPTPQHRNSPLVKYDVECFDVHVINPDYRFAAPAAMLVPDPSKPDHGAGVRMMMMLTVSGTVVFGTDRDAAKQHFNDVFILVPNWDVIARAGSRNSKRYLIASHTYRAY